MKLYIKGYSSYRDDIDNTNLKDELKKKYKLDVRRQNKFIHLGVFGAKKLQENVDIEIDNELYITSGIGNIDVFQKTLHHMHNDDFMKVFDFINMLGNTTSFYISKALGIKGKSIYQISDNFTFINSLISIYASLSSSKKEAILGSIDLVSDPDEIIKRVLGVDESCEIVSSVNYQKLSLSKENALGEIEFDTNFYSLKEIENILDKNESEIFTSMRCTNIKANKEDKFSQTGLSYTLNKFIEAKKDMLYVDCFDGKYKILRVKILL